MLISREEKVQEAVRRMKKMQLFPEVIRQFEKKGLVNCSEPPFGACFWLDDERKAFVKELEEKYGLVVFHAIHNKTEIGELYSYLVVSDYKEEWQQDEDNLKYGLAFCYVENLTYDDCSEFGTIGVELTPAGGLKRVS